MHADCILPIKSFIIYSCKYIVHLCIGFEWSYSSLEWLHFHIILVIPFILYIVLLVVLCLVVANGRR
jgi:hypothetical protein